MSATLTMLILGLNKAFLNKRDPKTNINLWCFYRHLLLCRVTLGKSFLQFSAMKMAHAPPGHHSVAGRPSAGGLNFPEYVVYRGEQAYPEYFITYQIVKPEDRPSGADSDVRWFQEQWLMLQPTRSFKDYLCSLLCHALRCLVPARKKCSCQEQRNWV